MRFANISFSFLILVTGGIFFQSPSLAEPWQIFGRNALDIELPDDQAAQRIDKFNQKLAKIVPRLNPDRNWMIDIRTTNYRRSAKVKSALIRLEGYNLIFVTEADAKAQGFNSVPELANNWAGSLSTLFSDRTVRQLLVVGMGMPTEINYRGVVYYLKPNIAADKGLFRTSGQYSMGRVVYWEVPADNKAYQITGNYKGLESTSPPSEVFLLNRNQKFLVYSRERS
jgi:hypothetical protein